MHLHMKFFKVAFYVSYKPVFEDYVEVTQIVREREIETHAKIWPYDDTSLYNEEKLKSTTTTTRNGQ